MSTSIIPAPSSGTAGVASINTRTGALTLKTINNIDLLDGAGNIDIGGGGTITVDNDIDSGSSNPVKNSAIATALDGKADKSATVSTVAWDNTNKKITKTINGNTTDVVTAANILGNLTKTQVTTALGYTPPTSDTNTHRPIQINGTQILGDNTTPLNLTGSGSVSVTNSNGTVTISGSGSARTYKKPWYVSDGTDNNTAGNVIECDTIQAAINGCPVHGTVYIPWYGTTYTISSQLLINKPLTLTSDHYGYEENERTPGAPSFDQIDKTLITYTGTDYAIRIRSIGVTLNNISIRTENGNGILVLVESGDMTNMYPRYFRFSDIFIQCGDVNEKTHTGTGIALYGVLKSIFENCVVYNSNDAFYVEGGTSLTFINCWARDYTRYGFNFGQLGYSSLINCCADTNSVESSTHHADDYQTAYAFLECRGLNMTACGAEGARSYLCAFSGCHGVSCGIDMYNTAPADDDYDQLNVPAPILVYNSYVVFDGCRHAVRSSNSIDIQGGSEVAVIGCVNFTSYYVLGTPTDGNGRLWLYPKVASDQLIG